jgi:SAM-dependent methyltransferase
LIDKQALIRHFDAHAAQRPAWFRRNHLYHDQIIAACRPFLNPDSRVLELGCSTGDMLNALAPSYGVGVDISPASIAIAQKHYPHLNWLCADIDNLPEVPLLSEPFDVIVLSDIVTYLEDVQQTLESIHYLTHSRSRLIISLWNWMWQPILQVGEKMRVKAPDLDTRYNWLSPTMISNLLELSGYTPLQVLPGVLLPYNVPGITSFVNTISHAPLVRRFTLLSMVVARPQEEGSPQPASVTVVIPTRNEVDNIEAAVQRTPEMGTHTELLFIDGNSTDGTVDKIHQQIAAHPERDIRFMPQTPPQSPDSDAPPDLMLKLGKGDAVRKAFAAAKGDIVIILDSDLTVPPEELPKFYNALVAGKAKMLNGTRFVYQQQAGAMRTVNKWGNVFFSQTFSWLLDQPITDTLCGTKAMFKRDYERIAANRSYFGDFDPFGDFDLLFGAARLKYRILDVPVHYLARTYGESKVRVGIHGPLLGQMSLIALWQLKIRPWLTGAHAMPEGNQQEKSQSAQSLPLLLWLLFSVGAMALYLSGCPRRKKR